MAHILYDLDGTPTPAEKCSWFEIAPCGCMVGAVMARVAVTEEAAWKELEPTAKQRRRAQAQGFRMEVGLRSRAREWADCEHKPRWGVAR